MASDLDTVRVLRALFGDMPRAPQGLSDQETMAWIQQSMTGFEGGAAAYAIEHITRNSMLDIVLRLRESGHLQEDAAFETMLQQISTDEGRKRFMDWCINARKTVDATSRLLNRAKPSWSEPQSLFEADAQEVARFVAAQPSGPSALFNEFAALPEVREIGLLDPVPERIYAFAWGFVTEEPGAWNFYLADVWRQGTVGCFDRFLSAWNLETGVPPDETLRPPAVPHDLNFDVGITSFSSLILHADTHAGENATRQWVGQVFISHMLPVMAGRVLDENYDFPSNW